MMAPGWHEVLPNLLLCLRAWSEPLRFHPKLPVVTTPQGTYSSAVESRPILRSSRLRQQVRLGSESTHKTSTHHHSTSENKLQATSSTVKLRLLFQRCTNVLTESSKTPYTWATLCRGC